MTKKEIYKNIMKLVVKNRHMTQDEKDEFYLILNKIITEKKYEAMKEKQSGKTSFDEGLKKIKNNPKYGQILDAMDYDKYYTIDDISILTELPKNVVRNLLVTLVRTRRVTKEHIYYRKEEI